MDSALLLFPAPEGRRWLRLRDPARVEVAQRLDDVVPRLRLKVDWRGRLEIETG